MKPKIPIRTAVVIIVFLFWLGIPCDAGNRLTNKKTAVDTPATDTRVVQIVLGGNEAGGWGYEPLQALSDALAHDITSRYFRVTWYFIEGSLSSGITALYDRQRGTIRYYCTGGHNMGGNPAEVVYAHYLYTGVTEQVIGQASVSERCRDQGLVPPLTRHYPDAIRSSATYYKAGTLGSYYDELLAFGCQRQKLP